MSRKKTDDHLGDNEPVGRMLKVVTVLDCTPGYADKADGEPISILTIEHLGEIDQPMMLSLRDSKRLATLLLAALAHHDDDEALEAYKIMSAKMTEEEE